MAGPFIATVSIFLHTPEIIEEDGQPDFKVVGYYQNVALNAFSIPHAKEIISVHLEDGPIEWSDSTLREVNPASLDPGIAKGHFQKLK